MLREDILRMMTDLAMFEKKHGAQIRETSDFFKSDYVGRHLLRGFFRYSVSFFLLFGLFLIFNLDRYLSNLSLNLLTTRITVTLAIYLVGLVIYLAVLATLRMSEYDESLSIRKTYEAKLRMMSRRYEYRNRAERLQREEKRL
ncbi:MAG: hypothetical protein J5947_02190 [Clostridium sp.]|nr:hypothetical protein [Clostridium sp.]